MSSQDGIMALATACARRVARGALAALAIALAMLVPIARAEAMPGDYELIQGRIVVWPPGTPADGVAVVRGADGTQYFVRVTPDTAVSPDLRDGASVIVVGREGATVNVIDAGTVERRETGRAS